jgi:Domain of unknown function (DUF4167)
MRHGTSSNNRRQRNRGNGGRRGSSNQQPQRTQVYDSNGPDVRIRGTAYQVAEKYLALAKDSYSAGDRIMAESYYQHAEHYIRIIGEFNGTFDLGRADRESSDYQEEDGNYREESVSVQIIEKEDLSLPASIIGGVKMKAPQASAPVKEAEVVE